MTSSEILRTYMVSSLFFMQIFVKELNKNQTITVDVDPTETVADLKRKIQEKVPGGMDKDVGLLLNGKHLQDQVQLKEYSIQPGNTVYMVLATKGGY